MGAYSHDDYVTKLKDKFNGKYEVLSRYTSSKDSVVVRCNDCGSVTERSAGKLMYRGGCLSCCALGRIKSHDVFVQQIKEKHGEKVTILGRYIKDSEKILIRHEACGSEYEVTATTLMQSLTCVKCSKERMRKHFTKTQEEFIADVKKVHGNKYTILGEYINAHKKILVRHNECGYEWETRPIGILIQIKSCPKCATAERKINCVPPRRQEVPESPCSECGKMYKPLRVGLCANCYARLPRIKEKNKKYILKKMENDIHFRIKHRLRQSVYHILRKCKTNKSKGTMELTGCNVSELKAHIEMQFQPGMSWDNWGRHGWHLDHIKPCAMFDLTKEDEQRKCFHYINLQPLWAFDNLSKGAKYNGYNYRGETIVSTTTQAAL